MVTNNASPKKPEKAAYYGLLVINGDFADYREDITVDCLRFNGLSEEELEILLRLSVRQGFCCGVLPEEDRQEPEAGSGHSLTVFGGEEQLVLGGDTK